jgi:hypothetical protein
MNGIVYHLDQRIEFPPGHLLCLESEWALTAVDQAPVWDGDLDDGPDQRPRLGPPRGSILSINVSDWFSPDRSGGRPARFNHRSDVSATVWHQLAEHMPALKDLQPVPILDPAIVEPAPNAPGGPPVGETGSLVNREPMLINTERSWADRPAAATTFDNLVLAGDYVRTETDFASMEAASEAARRAVRQILRTEDRLEEAPTIHGLEAPRSLRPLVGFIRGLDRLVRIVGLPHPLGLLSAPLGWAAGLENQARRLFAHLGRSPKLVTLPDASPPPERTDRPGQPSPSPSPARPPLDREPGPRPGRQARA